MFCNGDAVYKKFAKEYITHKKGLFIVAPSGSGKTHYIKHQKEKHWIDGDALWTAAGAHPNTAWWKEPLETILEIDQKSDVITTEAKKMGFWIMGASNFWLAPDAIVLPSWNIQKKYILKREQTHYDGGATSNDFAQVRYHRSALRKQARVQKIKVFRTIEEAVAALTKRVA